MMGLRCLSGNGVCCGFVDLLRFANGISIGDIGGCEYSALPPHGVQVCIGVEKCGIIRQVLDRTVFGSGPAEEYVVFAYAMFRGYRRSLVWVQLYRDGICAIGMIGESVFLHLFPNCCKDCVFQDLERVACRVNMPLAGPAGKNMVGFRDIRLNSDDVLLQKAQGRSDLRSFGHVGQREGFLISPCRIQ